VLFIGTQFSILYTSMYSPEGLDSAQCLSGSMTISPTGYHGVAKRSSWASSRIRDIMALPSAGVGASAAPRCPRCLCVYYCRTYCEAVCGGGGGQCHSEGYVQGLQDCACRRDGRTPILWTEIGRYGHAKKDPIISKRDLI